jgi:hypothetical protein
LPELLAADPGHGERFVAEGAGVLDYTKNRTTEQEVRSEALPRRSCFAADASSAWFFRAVVLAGPLSVVALIAGWVVPAPIWRLAVALPGWLRRLARAPLDPAPDAGPAPRVA